MNIIKRLIRLTLIFSLAITPASMLANVINVPDDFESIQEAVDNSADNDTIMVGAGVYNECIGWTREPANLTIIGSPEHQSIIDLENQEGGDFAVFVVTNVNSVKIENLVMRNLHQSGGIYSSNNEHIVIRNCILQTVHGSPAILIQTGISAIVEENIFRDCLTSALISNLASDPLVISRNEFSDSGHGIEVNHYLGHQTISNNTFVGIRVVAIVIPVWGDGNERKVTNNIFINSRRAMQFMGGYVEEGDVAEIIGETVFIDNNCLWNNDDNFRAFLVTPIFDGPWLERIEAFDPLPGQGMVYENPLFISVEDEDFRLTANSPCIDSGDPNLPEDPDGTRSDIGAYCFQQNNDNLISNLRLTEGWNMISINILPPENLWIEDEGPDIIRMTERLRAHDERHHIILLKNGDGQFFTPVHDFNNIPYWNLLGGYQIKVDENIRTYWAGEPIPSDADIPLSEGWNIIGYLPTYNLDVNAPDYYGFSPIIDNLRIAKNGFGEFLLPEFEFSNMRPLEPGQGFQVNVNEDLMFNYPDEEGERLQTAYLHSHFDRIISDNNMSVLLNEIVVDIGNGCDRVDAYTSDNILIGSGTIDANGRCGLCVWGDDACTDYLDGLIENQRFSLQLECKNNIHDCNLIPEKFIWGNSLTYTPDGLLALNVRADELPIPDYSLFSAYPNPFNSTIHINYSLSIESSVNLSVLDINGRLIELIESRDLQAAGNHTLIWNPKSISSGIYFINLINQDRSSLMKVVFFK